MFLSQESGIQGQRMIRLRAIPSSTGVGLCRDMPPRPPQFTIEVRPRHYAPAKSCPMVRRHSPEATMDSPVRFAKNCYDCYKCYTFFYFPLFLSENTDLITC
jgi:hypothetical protein